MWPEDEETFQEFAKRTLRPSNARIIRIDTRELTLDQLYEMRDDIYKDCPCCEGAGHHMRMATVELVPGFPMTGIQVLSCGTCGGSGQLAVYQTN